MAVLPWGKVDVGTNELPPKEATHMSREVKYIGMDVHKEATVIAVLNGNGDLVMESIVETKASSLLQGAVKVGAGSAWLWAREDMANLVDVLFVDEAGQMSLANV